MFQLNSWYEIATVLLGLWFVAFVFSALTGIELNVKDLQQRKLKETDSTTKGTFKIVRDSYPFSKEWATEKRKDFWWFLTIVVLGGFKITAVLCGLTLMMIILMHRLGEIFIFFLSVFLIFYALGIRIEQSK